MSKQWDKRIGTPVQTEDGSFTLKHPDHGEEYHSQLGARLEARCLYIENSGFLDALDHEKNVLRVLDVGLGLGYNAMETLEAWVAAPHAPDMELDSLEINGALVEALASGEGGWSHNWPPLWQLWCRGLIKVAECRWQTEVIHPNGQSRARWVIQVGDAATGDLPSRDYHFIWQDAFSPTKNPILWTGAWFRKLSAASVPGAVLMTYSVARVVKDGLTAGGWDYARIPGPGRKRHWMRATRPSTI